jgi:hypothetical protein
MKKAWRRLRVARPKNPKKPNENWDKYRGLFRICTWHAKLLLTLPD